MNKSVILKNKIIISLNDFYAIASPIAPTPDAAATGLNAIDSINHNHVNPIIINPTIIIPNPK